MVIISTENSAEDRKRGMELGARDYLVKPFSADALRAAARRIVGHGGGGAP